MKLSVVAARLAQVSGELESEQAIVMQTSLTILFRSL
jgi:hypothetical protein